MIGLYVLIAALVIGLVVILMQMYSMHCEIEALKRSQKDYVKVPFVRAVMKSLRDEWYANLSPQGPQGPQQEQQQQQQRRQDA